MARTGDEFLPFEIKIYKDILKGIPRSKFRKSVRNVYYLLLKNSALVDLLKKKYLLQDGSLDSTRGFTVKVGRGILDSYFVTYRNVPISVAAIMQRLGYGLDDVDENISLLFLSYVYIFNMFLDNGNSYFFYEDPILKPYLRG